MSALTIHVHGAMPPSDGQTRRLEQALARDLPQLGFATDEVTTFGWRSGHPAGAAIALGSLALLGGGLIGLGARAAWLAASAGAAGGAAATYRAARLGIQPAAQGLARKLHQAIDEHDEVHVVAHSLGTDVAVRALGQLASEGTALPGVLFTVAGTARASRDYTHLAEHCEQGIVNVYNPHDLALWIEIPVRLANVIGRQGMRGEGIRNVRTHRGHHDQVGHLQPILTSPMQKVVTAGV